MQILVGGATGKTQNLLNWEFALGIIPLESLSGCLEDMEINLLKCKLENKRSPGWRESSKRLNSPLWCLWVFCPRARMNQHQLHNICSPQETLSSVPCRWQQHSHVCIRTQRWMHKDTQKQTSKRRQLLSAPTASLPFHPSSKSNQWGRHKLWVFLQIFSSILNYFIITFILLLKVAHDEEEWNSNNKHMSHERGQKNNYSFSLVLTLTLLSLCLCFSLWVR